MFAEHQEMLALKEVLAAHDKEKRSNESPTIDAKQNEMALRAQEVERQHDIDKHRESINAEVETHKVILADLTELLKEERHQRERKVEQENARQQQIAKDKTIDRETKIVTDTGIEGSTAVTTVTAPAASLVTLTLTLAPGSFAVSPPGFIRVDETCTERLLEREKEMGWQEKENGSSLQGSTEEKAMEKDGMLILQGARERNERENEAREREEKERQGKQKEALEDEQNKEDRETSRSEDEEWEAERERKSQELSAREKEKELEARSRARELELELELEEKERARNKELERERERELQIELELQRVRKEQQLRWKEEQVRESPLKSQMEGQAQGDARVQKLQSLRDQQLLVKVPICALASNTNG